MSHIYNTATLVAKHPSFVNTEQDDLVANIKAAVQSGLPIVHKTPPTDQPIAIVGGGPSLALWELKLFHRDQGHHVMALGGAGVYLHSKGITPDSVVILDARAFNARFLYDLPDNVTLYLASQCHPAVFEEAKRFDNVFVWHAAHPCMAGDREMTASGMMVPKYVDPAVLSMSVMAIGGGTTVGLLSIPLAGLLGFRAINLHGFDSSYRDGKAHPYPQPENDGEDLMEIEFPLFSGVKYETSMWMASQAAKFERVSQAVTKQYDATISVHGDGLLPAFARAMVAAPGDAHLFARERDAMEGNADLDRKAEEILKRIPENARGVEVGVYQGEGAKRLLRANPSLNLTLVDSWGNYDGDPSDFHAKLLPQEQAEAIKHTVNNTSFAGERVTILKMRSVMAATVFADQSLDFVFLDADHRLEGVRADIQAWLPKVKPGGWIGGHDYGKPEFGVTGAVNERFKNIKLGADSTWFVQC